MADLDHLDEDFSDLTPEERAALIRIYGDQPRLSDKPTRTRPGSEARIQVYEDRFARRLAVLHPGDLHMSNFVFDEVRWRAEQPNLTEGRGMLEVEADEPEEP